MLSSLSFIFHLPGTRDHVTMKFLIIFAAVVACVAAATLEKCTPEEYAKYMLFKQKFGRPAFKQSLENKKCSIWKQRKVEVKLNNADPSTHDTEINHLSALTDEEFHKLLGFNVQAAATATTTVKATTKPTTTTKTTPKTTTKTTTKAPTTTTKAPVNDGLPASVDWRTSGFVSAVKDQGDNIY